MKQLNKQGTGNWIEILKVTLSEEDKAIQKGKDNVAKKALSDRIKLEREGVATEEDTAIVEALYLANKPLLEEGTNYELIAVDVTVNNDTASGIINCRVNGEHFQVRF